MARQRRHTPAQIIHKLREAERLQAQGVTIAEVAKQLEISEQTLHRCTTVRRDEGRRRQAAQRAGTRKRPARGIIADQALDIEALKEVAKETV